MILTGKPDQRFRDYPQRYSRFGFSHHYRARAREELLFILERHWKRLGRPPRISRRQHPLRSATGYCSASPPRFSSHRSGTAGATATAALDRAPPAAAAGPTSASPNSRPPPPATYTHSRVPTRSPSPSITEPTTASATRAGDPLRESSPSPAHGSPSSPPKNPRCSSPKTATPSPRPRLLTPLRTSRNRLEMRAPLPLICNGCRD